MAMGKEESLRRLSLRSHLNVIRKMPYAVLFKGFSLERAIKIRRSFNDIDVYVGERFRDAIALLRREGYRQEQGGVPLPFKHKVNMRKGNVVVELHRRLFPIYSPFRLDAVDMHAHVRFDDALRLNVFTPGFIFVYGVGHQLYGHMGSAKRDLNKRCSEVLKLYHVADKHAVLALAQEARMTEWCYIFLQNALEQPDVFADHIVLERMLDIQCRIISSRDMWWTYVRLAPWHLKTFALLDFLMKRFVIL